jgi:hypothetical protein
MILVYKCHVLMHYIYGITENFLSFFAVLEIEPRA